MTTLGTSIRIFLTDGTPDGLRLVEKANWTGLALVAPRSLYSQVRSRGEFDRPAVYLLRGPDDERSGGTKLYIGEADCARSRLDTHFRKEGWEWWEDLFVFTSKDENLNKAYIRHLEARLIDIATKAKRARLANLQSPQGPRLSEADQADAEGFLANMLLLYPVLGIDAFEQPRRDDASSTGFPLLYLRAEDTDATGRDLPVGFVVYEGSTGRIRNAPAMRDARVAWRANLLADGVFIEKEGRFHLTQDYTFSSPSAAALCLLGRSANGRAEWKDEDGTTLKAIQEAALPPDAEEDS